LCWLPVQLELKLAQLACGGCHIVAAARKRLPQRIGAVLWKQLCKVLGCGLSVPVCLQSGEDEISQTNKCSLNMHDAHLLVWKKGGCGWQAGADMRHSCSNVR